MQTPEILGPPAAKLFRKRTFDFLNQTSTRNPYLAAWLDKPCEVVQVEIVRPVVVEGIDTHDGVEKLRAKRQLSGIGVDWEHAILDAGIPDSLQVLRNVEP